MDRNLDLSSSAVIVWLPKGAQPSIDSFVPTNVQSPPPDNPEPWWILHEAITYAVTAMTKHDKLPWIKTGGQLLGPDEILKIYKGMGNLSGFKTNAQGT